MAGLADRIARLSPEKRAVLLRKLAQPRSDGGAPAAANATGRFAIDWHKNFHFVLGTPGNFDSLRPEALPSSPPDRGEIQVKVKAASMNFRDLMIAMALYPKTPGVPSIMGSDIAGEVLAVGEDVTEFNPGDRVMALSAGTLGPAGHFCAIQNILALQAVHMPPALRFDEAASVPTAFLTSYYALHHAAQLKSHERVLIHSATGGVGLAAIQVAKWIGAEIFATAGSESKRALLKSFGIETVLDSRSDRYAEQILEVTAGQGVDVVLNTLAGPAGIKGMEILGNFGRFLQINKQDIFQDTPLPLGHFRRGLSFSAIDLSLFVANPKTLNMLFTELADHIQRGSFELAPITNFPITELPEALRLISQYKHIGKLVLNYDSAASQPMRGGSL